MLHCLRPKLSGNKTHKRGMLSASENINDYATWHKYNFIYFHWTSKSFLCYIKFHSNILRHEKVQSNLWVTMFIFSSLTHFLAHNCRSKLWWVLCANIFVIDIFISTSISQSKPVILCREVFIVSCKYRQGVWVGECFEAFFWLT